MARRKSPSFSPPCAQKVDAGFWIGARRIKRIHDHGKNWSPSTIGRILKTLAAKGLVQKSSSASRTRRKRTFGNTHAKPLKYKEYKDMKLGERVQIDHMILAKNGIVVKHFQAWDRRSKFIYAQIYSHAKSTSAEKFLIEFIEKAPFTVGSIQVDGGSEFRADFEKACARLGIPLIVLPPSRPPYNGGVERGNRTFKEEFYYKSNLNADTIKTMRQQLAIAVDKYNTYRPYRALKGMTPMEYLRRNPTETPHKSHYA
jgi:predicted transcriptional regulator